VANSPAKPNKIKPTITPETTTKIPQGLVGFPLEVAMHACNMHAEYNIPKCWKLHECGAHEHEL